MRPIFRLWAALYACNFCLAASHLNVPLNFLNFYIVMLSNNYNYSVNSAVGNLLSYVIFCAAFRTKSYFILV